MKKASFLAACLALAACHSQPTAGGLSPDDERALDNAAAMLDQQNIFDGAQGDMAANESGGPPPAGNAAATPGRSGNAQ